MLGEIMGRRTKRNEGQERREDPERDRVTIEKKTVKNLI